MANSASMETSVSRDSQVTEEISNCVSINMKGLEQNFQSMTQSTFNLKTKNGYKPPDPNKAVATPDTYRTTFGSMRINWKSPKSTFAQVEQFEKITKMSW